MLQCILGVPFPSSLHKRMMLLATQAQFNAMFYEICQSNSLRQHKCALHFQWYEQRTQVININRLLYLGLTTDRRESCQAIS